MLLLPCKNNNDGTGINQKIIILVLSSEILSKIKKCIKYRFIDLFLPSKIKYYLCIVYHDTI